MPDPVEGKRLWLGNVNTTVVFMPDERTGWIQIIDDPAARDIR